MRFLIKIKTSILWIESLYRKRRIRNVLEYKSPSPCNTQQFSLTDHSNRQSTLKFEKHQQMIRIICYLNYFGKIMTETYCQMKYLREKKINYFRLFGQKPLKVSFSIMVYHVLQLKFSKIYKNIPFRHYGWQICWYW